MKYNVKYLFHAEKEFEVEAESEQEAKEKGEEALEKHLDEETLEIDTHLKEIVPTGPLPN
jgi:hypothetical protein